MSEPIHDDSTFCGLKKWFHHLIEKLGWLMTNEELTNNKKSHYVEQVNMWLQKITIIEKIQITDLEKHDIKVMKARLQRAKNCIQGQEQPIFASKTNLSNDLSNDLSEPVKISGGKSKRGSKKRSKRSRKGSRKY